MSTFPSDVQKRVIEHRGRPLVVVAGPGTGKTSTIVERILQLLSEDPERDVSFLTFTRTSRRDTDTKLRERFTRKEIDPDDVELPRVSTLHRFAKHLVHKYAAAIGRDEDFSVLNTTQGETAIVVSEALADAGLNMAVEDACKALTHYRSTGDWPVGLGLGTPMRTAFLQVFERLLRFYNTIDMEGVVVTACEILSRPGMSGLSVLLQVDEYQDLNPIDQQMVRLIGVSPSSEVVVVGDDAQSIYGFRHANPAGIRELWNSDEWDKVLFKECHRLPAHILRAANALIKDSGYIGAEVALPDEVDKKVLTLQCTSSGIQVRAVASKIREIIANEKCTNGDNITYKNFMVLCPIRNHVNKVASELAEGFQIPTKTIDPGSMSDDIWRLILVLRLLADSDSLALRQWLDFVGVTDSEIGEMRAAAMSLKKSLFEYCSSLIDNRIAIIFQALTNTRESVVDPSKFQRSLENFPSLQANESISTAIAEIVEFLPSIPRMKGHLYEKYGVLDAEEDRTDVTGEDEVLVTTMHSAKGLEAEFVFVMWLNRTFIPARGRDVREEERLLYVALTRAKQDAILTFYEEYDRANRRRLREQAMSPFLRSIRAHLDVQRITAASLKALAL